MERDQEHCRLQYCQEYQSKEERAHAEHLQEEERAHPEEEQALQEEEPVHQGKEKQTRQLKTLIRMPASERTTQKQSSKDVELREGPRWKCKTSIRERETAQMWRRWGGFRGSHFQGRDRQKAVSVIQNVCPYPRG